MKPWECPETLARVRAMTGDETVRAGIRMTEAAVGIFAESIRAANPGLTEPEVEAEMRRLLWGKSPWTTKPISRL